MKPQEAARGKNRVPLWSFVSFVVMVLSLLGCTIGKESKHPSWKGATGAEQYERLMWQAIRDKDWKEVEYHLAPTFVGVDASGSVFDRAGWVEHWKRSQIKGFSLAEVVVNPAGAGMVVSYVLHIDMGGGAPTAPSLGLRVVSVWQQVKGGWALSATSLTPVTSPAETR
jgi:ketosteroid isomerase-like protein